MKQLEESGDLGQRGPDKGVGADVPIGPTENATTAPGDVPALFSSLGNEGIFRIHHGLALVDGKILGQHIGGHRGQ